MKSKKKKGFTLIELIASIAILLIVMTAAYQVLSSGNILFINGVKKDNVVQNARLAVTSLSQTLKVCRAYSTDIDDSKYDSIPTSEYAKKLVYIEGNDNSRFMYVLKDYNGEKGLFKLYFNPVEKQKYKISDSVTIDEIPASESIDSQNIVEYKTGDIVNSNKIPDGYTPESFIYEKDGETCSLCVTKLGIKYRIKLDKYDQQDYTITKREKVAENIEDITINSDGDSCKIYVYTKDGSKEKKLTTSIFILNNRGEV